VSLTLPHEVAEVLTLLGFTWPEADEDRLMEAARHWREFASEVGQIRETTNRHAKQVADQNTGASVDAFNQYWEEIGGGSGHLDDAQRAAEAVADVLDGFAAVVVSVKAEVIAQLLILAAELVADTAAAFVTFGATEAAAAGEVAIQRIAVREILQRIVKHIEEKVADTLRGDVLEMFQRMLRRAIREAVGHATTRAVAEGAIEGALGSGALDLGWQWVEVNELHTKSHIDWHDVAGAAGGGAVIGGAAGAVHGAVGTGGRTNLYRREGGRDRAPILPMNMSCVRDVARRYGVDITDVTVRIRNNRIGYEGVTGPDGTVHLTRDAFRDEETLARTLYHERFHVDQLRQGLRYPRTEAEAEPYERAAYSAEKNWWAAHPLNPVRQESP
jgi:hypothetical protein